MCQENRTSAFSLERRRRPLPALWGVFVALLLLPCDQAAGQAPSAPAGPTSRPTATARANRLERTIDRLIERQDQLEKKLAREQVDREARALNLEQELSEGLAAGAEAPSRSRLLELYGFFDLNFGKWWIPDAALFSDIFDKRPVFAFGQLNVYIDSTPAPSIRFLAEIRFLLNPLADADHFENKQLGQTFAREETATWETFYFMDRLDTGSLEIERAWVNWESPFNWLRVTAGLFLTPYGVWNIDHGSPTRIIASRPLLYTYWASFFPERQLGIKLHGSWLAGDVELGYALTVTNGRNPVSTATDLDWDKGLGLRLEAQGEGGSVRWKAGLSAYTGQYTDTKMVVYLVPETNMKEEVTVKYREVALGADLTLDAGPFSLVGEIVANWRNYHKGLREPAPMWGFIPVDSVDEGARLGNYAKAADRIGWGGYAIASYRLPFASINLRPYVHAFYVDFSDNVTADNSLGVGGGLNWHIAEPLVLKLEHMVYIPTAGPWPAGYMLHGADFIQSTMSQLAVAF